MAILWGGARRGHEKVFLTKQTITCIYTDIAVMEYKKSSSVIGEVSGLSKEGMVHGVVASKIESEERLVTRCFLVLSDGEMGFDDAWGNRLFFTTRQFDSYSKLRGEMINEKDVIVVWSAGKNGINEFGFGDDIIVNR